MSFYQLMAVKYANRRTFAPETEGAAGTGGEADTKTNSDAGDDADAGSGKTAEKADVKTEAKVETKTEAKVEVKTDDEKAALLREVMDKKTKLKDVEEKLKSYEGIDPDRYKALIAKEVERERAEAEQKGDFERVKQMMAEAHKADKADLERTIEDLKSQLNGQGEVIDRLTVGNTFGSSKFIRDNMVLSPTKTRVLYGAHFESENGEVVAYDKPRGAANRTKLVNASGDPLSFDQALAKIVDADPDKKDVLRSTVKPGAASTTTKTDGKTEQKTEQPAVYGRDRIRLSLEKEG